jgi:hypothetical protein
MQCGHGNLLNLAFNYPTLGASGAIVLIIVDGSTDVTINPFGTGALIATIFIVS